MHKFVILNILIMNPVKNDRVDANIFYNAIFFTISIQLKNLQSKFQ